MERTGEERESARALASHFERGNGSGFSYEKKKEREFSQLKKTRKKEGAKEIRKSKYNIMKKGFPDVTEKERERDTRPVPMLLKMVCRGSNVSHHTPNRSDEEARSFEKGEWVNKRQPETRLLRPTTMRYHRLATHNRLVVY